MEKLVSLSIAMLCVGLVGCSEEWRVADTLPENHSIAFNASIDSTTRVVGSSWEEDDAIGVYMFPEDGSIADDCINSNFRHVHRGEGTFVPSPETDPDPAQEQARSGDEEEGEAQNDALYYPQDGSAVKFVAYYPYNPLVDEHIYPIDVTDQSRPAEIDFLYSRDSRSYTSGKPSLNFYHKLTRLLFMVTPMEDESIEGITAVMTGMRTLGSFDLSEGVLTTTEDSEGDIALRVVSSEEESAALEAIVLPQEDIDIRVVFTFTDGERAVLNIEGASYVSEYAYTYNVAVNKSAEAVVIEDSSIDEWKDGGSSNHEIDKGGNGGDEPPPSGEVEIYYKESFGEDDPLGFERTILGEYEGWSSGMEGVTYYDSGSSGIQIRIDAMDPNQSPYMRFPAQMESEVVISGLPAGYSDIVLSCGIKSPQGMITNPVKIWVGDQQITPLGDFIPILGSELTTISAELPDGTTSIRLSADLSASATIYIGIDDITLRGRE